MNSPESEAPRSYAAPRLDTKWLSAAVLGLVVLIFAPPAVFRLLGAPLAPSPWRDTFAAFFLSITLEALPFILLGTGLTTLMELYLPPDLLPRFTKRLGVWGIPIAALLSPIFPVCDCAVVIVVRGLIRKGLPVSHAVTYMLAAPILNPAVFLSTWLAFQNYRYAICRTVGGFVVAVTLGLALFRVEPRRILRPEIMAMIEPRSASLDPWAIFQGEQCQDCNHDHHDHPGRPATRRGKLLEITDHLTQDFLEMMPFFLAGVLMASLFKTLWGGEVLTRLGADPLLGPLAMMAAAFVLSICSEADAFTAAGFTEFNFVSHQAFLVLGPMLDLKLVLMYSSLFKRRFVVLLGLGICFCVGAYVALLGIRI